MAVGGVFGGYVNGTVASIRKQAEAIRQRTMKLREARIAEQDRTGMIQDPKTGKMVEISSISEETREQWNNHLDWDTVSPGEVMLLFKDADPHLEDVERSKELGKIATKLQNKMLSGKTWTGKEKNWLRENDFTALASMADRMEAEAEQLKSKLARCKSKDEARQVYMDAKARLVGGADKNDGSALFLSAVLDETYSQHTKRGASKAFKLDIWA